MKVQARVNGYKKIIKYHRNRFEENCRNTNTNLIIIYNAFRNPYETKIKPAITIGILYSQDIIMGKESKRPRL